jgi:hypothetical protein
MSGADPDRPSSIGLVAGAIGIAAPFADRAPSPGDREPGFNVPVAGVPPSKVAVNLASGLPFSEPSAVPSSGGIAIPSSGATGVAGPPAPIAAARPTGADPCPPVWMANRPARRLRTVASCASITRVDGMSTIAVVPPYGDSRSLTLMPCRSASRPTT